jgi:hypothetical protein
LRRKLSPRSGTLESFHPDLINTLDGAEQKQFDIAKAEQPCLLENGLHGASGVGRSCVEDDTELRLLFSDCIERFENEWVYTKSDKSRVS